MKPKGGVMQRRVLGKARLQASVIGFGGLLTRWLSLREAQNLVEGALDVEVNFLLLPRIRG